MWCLKCQSQWHETQGFITSQLTQTQASQDSVIVCCQKDTFEFQCVKYLLLYFPCYRLRIAFRNESRNSGLYLLPLANTRLDVFFPSCNKLRSRWSREGHESAIINILNKEELFNNTIHTLDAKWIRWGNRACGLWKPGLSLHSILSWTSEFGEDAKLFSSLSIPIKWEWQLCLLSQKCDPYIFIKLEAIN